MRCSINIDRSNMTKLYTLNHTKIVLWSNPDAITLAC
jgi:hypothetical protein